LKLSRNLTTRIISGATRRIKLVVESATFPVRLIYHLNSQRIQKKSMQHLEIVNKRKLIIFFIPGIQSVTGGVLQIFTLHRLTREFFKNSDTDALICWLPREGWESYKFSGFNNDVTIFRLKSILKICCQDCELLFHLPEYAAMTTLEQIGWKKLASMREKHGLKINILNQNIVRMLDPEEVGKLKKIFPDMTSTAGNPVGASKEQRQRLGIPLHLLPTWYYPDDAPWQEYESKKNLMIVSPDQDPHRDLVLDAIRHAIPELEIRVVQGLKYEEYLGLERSAKWSLTFGEGLDGYFYGPVLRGGVSFAVRNNTFDVLGFNKIKSVYHSYKEMVDRIGEDILELDSKQNYEGYNHCLRKSLMLSMGRERTELSLRSYYEGSLNFP